MTKAEIARQAAIDRVGDAYVYGAWDQACTVANRNKYANLSPEYADAIRNVCQRQSGKKASCDGCKYQGHRIHDCRGLTSACAGEAGVSIKGQTVARHWNEQVWERKGEIATLPKDARYAQLFRHNGSKWAHTGCYIGGGETVDARGHSYGTIRKKLTDYKWTHWAIPAGLGEDAPTEPTGGESVIYQAEVTTKSGSLNIRSGPGSDYPKVGSLPKGEIVDVMMDYGDWAYIGGDGKQGYVSKTYLTRIDTQPATEPEPEAQAPETRWGVFVPCPTEADALALAEAYKGSILTCYKPPDEGKE